MYSADGTATPGARMFAWAGTLLFFGSLSFFLFTYAVTFGENVGPPTDGASPHRAVLVNVALFTIFALHHSVFAREGIRDWMARRVSPRLERACYVWIASLMLIGVCLLWQPVPGIAWAAERPWAYWLALAAQGIGVWLAVHSASTIDILELSGVRQLTPDDRPAAFKTKGPYGWVRHPIYVGWFLMVFGVPTMTMTRLVFASVSSAYLLIAIPFEERSLKRVAGEAYERYARQVRWRLIPGIY